MRERFYWFKRWSHMEFVNSVVVEVPPRSTVRCLPSATVSTTVLWIFSAFSLSFGWRNICDGILDLSFTKWKNESKRFILGITFPVRSCIESWTTSARAAPSSPILQLHQEYKEVWRNSLYAFCFTILVDIIVLGHSLYLFICIWWTLID